MLLSKPGIAKSTPDHPELFTMFDYTNVIAFAVILYVTVKLIGRILELEEVVMDKEYEIRILKRNSRCQEGTITRLRAAVAAVETDPREEIEEGEIVEPAWIRYRR
jgi:hypothetical protein